ncbi:RDD family protein [Henriciella aquimarina]|uniref:RDD family protein n=1 Tax=Henriciella aquimarina TaxID=545261 RepID=UPI0011799B5F|nr:RDD family protein [Henriciella aquimarina]
MSWFGMLVTAPFAIFALRFPQREGRPTYGPVRLWKRFLAFFIDFFVSVAIFTSPLVLFELGLEASWTGHFSWQVERDFSRPTDWVHALLTFLMLGGVFSYFWLLPKVGRATIGQYIMGYRVEPSPVRSGASQYAHRTFAAFVALCVWPLTLALAAGQTKPGEYWWDRVSRTRAFAYT